MEQEEIKFVHSVSKGSKYNQIYIPENKREYFNAGDVVEVRLLRKKNELHYSKSLKSLGSFKERLIGEIFSFLSKYKKIKQMFVFGSFLTKKVDYNDIDILVLTDKEEGEEFDKKLYDNLSEEFNLKFHVISAERKSLLKSLKIGPMTRSMLYYFVSDKKFDIPKEVEIDKNHILTLLMMPEDLLEIKFENGKVYYDSLRKLIVIEKFLEDRDMNINEMNKEIEGHIGVELFKKIQKNEFIRKKEVKKIEEVISKKLNNIKKIIK